MDKARLPLVNFRILQDLNMLASGSEESGTVRAVSPTKMETNMSVNLKTM